MMMMMTMTMLMMMMMKMLILCSVSSCTSQHMPADHNIRAEVIRQTRARLSDQLPIEIKIRIHDDIRNTLDLARGIEMAGMRVPRELWRRAIIFGEISRLRRMRVD